MREYNPFLNIFNGRYNGLNSFENLLVNGLFTFPTNNGLKKYPVFEIPEHMPPNIMPPNIMPPNTNTNTKPDTTGVVNVLNNRFHKLFPYLFKHKHKRSNLKTVIDYLRHFYKKPHNPYLFQQLRDLLGVDDFLDEDSYYLNLQEKIEELLKRRK